MTFLNYSFRNQNVFGLQSSGQVIHGLGGLLTYLALGSNLSLYINDDIYDSNFSTLKILSTTEILIIRFWLIGIQLAQDRGQRGQERE